MGNLEPREAGRPVQGQGEIPAPGNVKLLPPPLQRSVREERESPGRLGKSSTLPPVSVSRCEKRVSPPPALRHLQRRSSLCGRNKPVGSVRGAVLLALLLLVTGVQPAGRDLCSPLCQRPGRLPRAACAGNAAAMARLWGLLCSPTGANPRASSNHL